MKTMLWALFAIQLATSEVSCFGKIDFIYVIVIDNDFSWRRDLYLYTVVIFLYNPTIQNVFPYLSNESESFYKIDY